MVAWTAVWPLIFVSALMIFEERVSIPSCEVVPRDVLLDNKNGEEELEDLKVMMVANLHLMGSEAGYMNSYFRDFYMTKFLRKSFESLKPDMLIVLGDVSAKGSELTSSKWFSVLEQFQGIVGPFLGLPLHIVIGDRDIGECSKLNADDVNRITKSFPGLDSAGCGAFDVGDIPFISLNAVALLCGNNDLRFSVEKSIERESIDLQTNTKVATEGLDEPSNFGENFNNFIWRENDMPSGSGPVLLLHFPLHRTTNNNYGGMRSLEGTLSFSLHEGAKTPENRREGGEPGPYKLSHTVPPNATEYILQALKPRIVFSAHTHSFCDYTHKDGTREVTVPAMTWDARDDPRFVIATFRKNRMVTVSQCYLARESHVLVAYITVLFMVIASTSHLLSLGR